MSASRASGPVRIAILGAGGNSHAIADAILAANAASGTIYELIGFFDDLPQNQGARVMGFPVLGTLAQAREAAGCQFVNGIASVQSFRMKPDIVARVGLPRERYETIVHPRAAVALSATVGRGSAIMALSAVSPEAVIGDHVLMLECSTVNHHTRVDDFVTISAGVTILGCVHVGASAFVGGGASIAPYTKIGEGALVGMGAAVIRDVVPGAVVAGNPATVLSGSPFTAKPAS